MKLNFKSTNYPFITNPIIVHRSLAFDLADNVQRDADLDYEFFQDIIFQAGNDEAEQSVERKNAGIANQILFILFREGQSF